MISKLGRILLAMSVAVAFSGFAAMAADYPAKPVEMIVSYAPGGGQDTSIRVLAKFAEKYLGQRIVVVNMHGGGNMAGNIAILQSKPDGYVVGTWVNGLVTDEFIFKGTPYTYKSFEPLCHVVADPHVLTIRKSLGINDMKTFMKYVQDNPGKVTFGAGGNWTTHDFFRIKMEQAGNLSWRRMPYLGGAPALRDVAADACDVTTPLVPEILPMLDSGKVTALAVASEKRVAQLPDIPTCKEEGYDIVQSIWRGLTVPKGTPKEVFDKLESVFKQTLEDPEAIDAMHKAGVNPVWMDHVEFAKFLEREHTYYSKALKEWGVEPR